jgi:hypothetical protein
MAGSAIMKIRRSPCGRFASPAHASLHEEHVQEGGAAGMVFGEQGVSQRVTGANEGTNGGTCASTDAPLSLVAPVVFD